MSPSTGGYIFEDISVQDTSEVEYERFVESVCE
jgi:hypothetical protein